MGGETQEVGGVYFCFKLFLNIFTIMLGLFTVLTFNFQNSSRISNYCFDSSQMSSVAETSFSYDFFWLLNEDTHNDTLHLPN